MVGGIVMSIEEKAKEYRSNTFGTPFSSDIAMAFSEGGLNGCLKKPVNTRGVNIQFTIKNGMN